MIVIGTVWVNEKQVLILTVRFHLPSNELGPGAGAGVGTGAGVGEGDGDGDGEAGVSEPVATTPPSPVHRVDMLAPFMVNVAVVPSGVPAPTSTIVTVAVFPLTVPLIRCWEDGEDGPCPVVALPCTLEPVCVRVITIEFTPGP